MDSPRFKGGLATASAFLIWGLFPLFWKLLSAVPSIEVTAHRIVWTCVLMIVFVTLRGRLREVTAEFENWRRLLPHAIRAVLLSSNWLLYVIAISTDHILEASLGYFLVPIINVALGRLVLGEQLSGPKKAAVVLAAIGVLNLALHVTNFPWLALGIAFSFGLYGLLRKQASVGSVPGLALETLSLFIPAVAFLALLAFRGTGALLHPPSSSVPALLILGGLVTAIPLILFAYGARRIDLATVGIFQYLAPTGKFFLGLWVYHEPLSHAELISFFFIWTALALYSWAGLRGTGQPAAVTPDV